MTALGIVVVPIGLNLKGSGTPAAGVTLVSPSPSASGASGDTGASGANGATPTPVVSPSAAAVTPSP